MFNKILEVFIKYLISLTLFLTGCVSIHTTELKSQPAKSKECKIDVFKHKLPDKKFEEIALLSNNGLVADLLRVLPDLKKKACLAGGDAIIFSQKDTDAATVIKYIE